MSSISKKQVVDLETRYVSLNDDVSKLEEKLRLRKEELENDQTDLKFDKIALTEEVRNLMGQETALSDKIGLLEQRITDLRDIIKTGEEKASRGQIEAQNLSVVLDNKRKEVELLDSEIKLKNESLRQGNDIIHDQQVEINKKLKEIQADEDRLDEEHRRLMSLGKELDVKNIQIQGLENKLKEKEQSIEIKENNIKNKEEALKRESDKIEQEKLSLEHEKNNAKNIIEESRRYDLMARKLQLELKANEEEYIRKNSDLKKREEEYIIREQEMTIRERIVRMKQKELKLTE